MRHKSTIAEVAKRAGVAPSVVSRLLNEDAELRIRHDTRERIFSAVEELGYVPNSAARSLRMAKAGALGFVVPNVTNPIYAEILRGAAQAGGQSRYVTLLANADDLANHESRYWDLTASGRVDGLLLQRTNTMSDDALRRFLSTSVPTILMNSHTKGCVGSVALDDMRGASLAVGHLLDLGHTRVAHLGGPEKLDNSRRRRKAYRHAMTRSGLSIEPGWIAMSGFDPQSGAEGVATLLSQEPRPTAIFAANVNAAVGALTYLHTQGIRVPEELSMVALHDTWFAAHTYPPLTTVKMPLFELGETAARLLVEVIQGGSPRDLVVREPAPELCVRESTSAPMTLR